MLFIPVRLSSSGENREIARFFHSSFVLLTYRSDEKGKKKEKKEKEKIKKLCRGNEHVRTRYINVPDHIPDTRTDTKSRR